jgi:hypothetical protein
MKAGKYTVRELFVNNYIDQIIIPEIQRDYVWVRDQVYGLLDSIKSDYISFNTAKINVTSSDPQIEKLFNTFYRKHKYSSNIGFIYAYNDETYGGKYFLIDGQQRLTTIYLLLLAVCIDVDKDIFKKYYYENKLLKLDYRVRDAAHEFLCQFVEYLLGDGDSNFEEVKSQYWYHGFYDNDKTIKNLASNYSLIKDYIVEFGLNDISFLEYVQNYVEFWYFDTNLSDQGEELYIYMNARGEQIQENENLKAELLGRLKNQEDKNKWGIIWEDWQDYFWQNKGKNENADTGFNEFLKCIAGLEVYKLTKKDTAFKEKSLTELISLELIDKKIKTLKFIECQMVSFISKYDCATWVIEYHKLVWNYLNKEDNKSANWFENYTNKNRGNDLQAMVLMWSLFLYFEVNNAELSVDSFFRYLRVFYVRFHNFNRSVSTLNSHVEMFISKGIYDPSGRLLYLNESDLNDETDRNIRTKDEQMKAKFLNQFIDDEELLRKYESIIWEIEDYPLNLAGKDLRNINISHLVDLNENPSFDQLNLIKERFMILGQPEGFDEKILITLLLHFGEFWNEISPYYYENLKFNNWGRIIRNLNGDKKAFGTFFSEFVKSSQIIPLQTWLDKKELEFINRHIDNFHTITDRREQLILYSIINKDIWENGYYIAVYGVVVGEQRIFPQERQYWNTRGDFKGYSPIQLWNFVKGKDIKQLLLNSKAEIENRLQNG